MIFHSYVPVPEGDFGVFDTWDVGIKKGRDLKFLGFSDPPWFICSNFTHGSENHPVLPYELSFLASHD